VIFWLVTGTWTACNQPNIHPLDIGVDRMPQALHIEHHFTGSELVRDIVIGMSDGLTVPIALAAGLSSIANSTAIVITGGLAAAVAFGLAKLISRF
jgi:hypothetical protein